MFYVGYQQVWSIRVRWLKSKWRQCLIDMHANPQHSHLSHHTSHGHKNPITTPTAIPIDFPVKQVFLGHNSMALLDSDGELYTCGYGGSVMNGMGALGHGDGESYLTPRLVESLVEDGCFAKQVHLGDEHTAVLTTEGEVLTAGAGSYGRLGNFESNDQLFLEPVELLATGVVQITGGKAFTLALTKDGLVQGWGRNDKGQVRRVVVVAVKLPRDYRVLTHSLFSWEPALEWRSTCMPWRTFQRLLKVTNSWAEPSSNLPLEIIIRRAWRVAESSFGGAWMSI